MSMQSFFCYAGPRQHLLPNRYQILSHRCNQFYCISAWKVLMQVLVFISTTLFYNILYAFREIDIDSLRYWYFSNIFNMSETLIITVLYKSSEIFLAYLYSKNWFSVMNEGIHKTTIFQNKQIFNRSLKAIGYSYLQPFSHFKVSYLGKSRRSYLHSRCHNVR